MTRLLCAVAAIALIAPTAASAQRQHDRDNKSSSTAQQRQDKHNNSQPAPNRQQNRHQNIRTSARQQQTHGTPYRPTSRPVTRQSTRTVTHNVYRIGHRPTTYHRIRATGFSYPSGYRYRHWGVGAILPRLFLSNSYYWNDYGALGLLPPPPGYVWVRYGPDLLLVNRYTGRIADVIYGAFY